MWSKTNRFEKQELIVRQFEPTDIDSCRHLWLQLTEWHREIYQSPGIGGDKPGLFFDEHLARVGAENIWVAEFEGEVIGMTGLIPGTDVAELEPMIVSQPFRGLGAGRSLVKRVIEEAIKSGSRQLKVRPVGRNGQAIRFFHELGFNIIGHIELFQELASDSKKVWVEGERLADREFKM